MDIIKSTGAKEPFNEAKLCTSLKMAGAPEDLANAICKNVRAKVTPGISSSKLHREALSYLVKEDADIAARYSLFRGIAALGPAGYLFEQYIEVVLQAYGYKTMRDTYVQGACIKHEIDIVAIKDDMHYILELKYHNSQVIKTHAPTVMYAWARLEDIAKAEEKVENHKYKHAMWLITNTKFTDTAIQYAKCKGVKMSGWNYPHPDSLETMIVGKKMYPVTVLPSVDKDVLAVLVKKKIILAQDLATYSVDDLSKLGVAQNTAQSIVGEVQGLFKR